MKTFLTFLFLLLGSISVIAQQSSNECPHPRQDQSVLVGAFRVLNTAEMGYNHSNHRFATVAELVGFEDTKKLAANKRYAEPVEGSVQIGSADDPLPGYAVHSIVGVDGKSYSITATKKDGPCKGVGATTDERGLIYFVEPLR